MEIAHVLCNLSSTNDGKEKILHFECLTKIIRRLGDPCCGKLLEKLLIELSQSSKFFQYMSIEMFVALLHNIKMNEFTSSESAWAVVCNLFLHLPRDPSVQVMTSVQDMMAIMFAICSKTEEEYLDQLTNIQSYQLDLLESQTVAPPKDFVDVASNKIKTCIDIRYCYSALGVSNMLACFSAESLVKLCLLTLFLLSNCALHLFSIHRIHHLTMLTRSLP